jgi:hypothetical protein
MNKLMLYVLCSGARVALRLTLLLCLWTSAAWAQVSVLTQHNDNSRTGTILETTLTPANVNVLGFGKLFSMHVDGFVFAQPLYMPNLVLPSDPMHSHNVLFVASAHNSVYAFDADTGKQLWKVSLNVGPNETSVPMSVANEVSIQVEVGIISTPVIDPSTNTLYVVPKSYDPVNKVQHYRLHALDILTGAEKLGGPVIIAAQYPGTGGAGDTVVGNPPNTQVVFVAAQHLQRAAVTLVNKVIYLAFASHDDHTPYHGWVMAYSTANGLPQLAAFNDTPNDLMGGIWMSGQGLVADSSNNVYLITGNSLQTNGHTVGNYGESFLQLGLSGNMLSVLDYFTPHNYDALNAVDQDLGSGGPVAIPGTSYIIGGGKQGFYYLVNTNPKPPPLTMGEFDPNSDFVRQEFQGTQAGMWGSPVFWYNPAAPTLPTLYVWGRGDALKAFTYNPATGRFPTNANGVVVPAASTASINPPLNCPAAPVLTLLGHCPSRQIQAATMGSCGRLFL